MPRPSAAGDNRVLQKERLQFYREPDHTAREARRFIVPFR
jgi:hypothetical protein